MTSQVMMKAQRSYSEEMVEPLPDFDPQVAKIFDLVTSQSQPYAPPSMTGFSALVITAINPEERKKWVIVEKLRSFICLQKMGATPTEVFYEALQKGHKDITGSLIAHISAHDAGQGFTWVCAYGDIEMAKMFLADDRIGDAHLTEGFRLVCDIGNAEIAAELKHHPKISQTNLDAGYLIAYQESNKPELQARHTTIMEILSEKVSAEGIGKVFIQACKDSRQDVAIKLMQNPRLKLADLQRGLAIAEGKGFADALKSQLDAKTRIQLYFYNSRRTFFFSGLLTAVVGGTILYSNLFTRMPQAELLDSTPVLDSLRMVNNLDDFFANTQRCCSLPPPK